MLAAEVTKNYAPLQLPVRPRKLIDLPENYLTLLSKADQFKCPNSVTKESKSPCLCLVCGTIVCSQVCFFKISCCNLYLLFKNQFCQIPLKSSIHISCLLQSPCCELQMDRVKAGGCTVHARRCGGDNGIFLRLRKCQVILLSDVKRGM